MKKTLILVLVVASFLTTSCGNEKKASEQRDSISTPTVKGPLPADNELTRNYTAQFGGHTYAITVHRTPDKSLPTVKDALDQEFYDNSVDVAITRDGETFFSKTFTKEAFEDYLEATDRNNSILLGMAYDEEKSGGSHICLAAQVGQPCAGEGPAFTIDIPTTGGAYSILRDTQQDTNAEQTESN